MQRLSGLCVSKGLPTFAYGMEGKIEKCGEEEDEHIYTYSLYIHVH